MEDEHGVDTERARQLHRILGLLDSARSVALKDGLDPHLVEEAALYWSVSHAYHSDPDDLVSKLVHVVGAVTQAERRRSSDA
jgi:hypothetical protein